MTSSTPPASTSRQRGEFAHLHAHSHYSLLDGLGKIDDMVAHVKSLGMDSLALTDHGVMYGTVEFIRVAREHNIRPIVGVEAYLAPGGHTKKRGKIDANPRHLTLLAQNNAGYKNLVKLTTTAHLAGYYYKPRIDYDLLEQHSEGVIVLSGCMNSDISRAILEHRLEDAERLITWHKERFGADRFYLEVQDHPNITEQNVVNQALIRYATQFQLKLVATCDSHYIRPEDNEAQDVLLCVQTGKQVSDTDRMNMMGEDFSLKSPDQVKAAWKDHPEAVATTQAIAEMCSVDLEFGVNRLPPFPLPPRMTANQLLRRNCEKGLQERFGDNLPPDAQARLDYELSVIEKTGYASYFLIVADFVNEAKRRGILVGPGRGSAAGSLVSYVTNITNLDPLHYNLLFERFLNPERISMPDIDLDFADDRRDEVINYVREKYGHEHVAQIITFGTMAARAAVRDSGRALGFPYGFCDQVAKAIPPFADITEALATAELRQLYDGDPQVRRLLDMAKKLEGVVRHASTHAAGVVITDEPLTEYLPLQLGSTAADEHDTVTQYAMGDVEALGLLKIDFLGLKNLTIIQNTLNRITERHKINLDLDTLPLDDRASYQLLKEGKTTGVFQLESAGMKRYLKELAPTELEDIISMVALYRPGPMDSIPDFIAAKHGRKKITYLHPLLTPILEKTYGVIVTQDQVLQIAREFAGFTYAQADILRKAVGKKIKSLLDEQREKFIEGAITNKQIDPQTARQVWDFIEPFARYGFNRAHAACYAMIAYQTAYLKANYPAEFMAALLTSDEGNIDRASVEVAESVSMGLAILPPDVNESGENFTVVVSDKGDAIRFGLGAIKNVGHTTVSALIAERQTGGPFKDLADLFARLDSKHINRKSVESLARAGAFDCLGERAHVLANTERLLQFNRSLHQKQDRGQQGLFGTTTNAPLPKLTLESAPVSTKDERLAWEKELLGMYVSEHPLSEYRESLLPLTTPIAEISQISSGEQVRIAGLVSKSKKITTKKGDPMLFAEIEDMAATCEVVVFPGVFRDTAAYWTSGTAVIVAGKTNDKDGEIKILADKVWPLNATTISTLKPHLQAPRHQSRTSRDEAVYLHLPPHSSPETLQLLKTILASAHTVAGAPVVLIVPNGGSRARVSTPFRLQLNPALSAQLRDVIGVGSTGVPS